MRFRRWSLVLGVLGALGGCGEAMPGLDAGRDAGYRRGDSGEGTTDAASPDDTGPPQDAASYEDGGPGDGGPLPTARSLPTQGSAIVLTSDDSIAVAANRQANTISVFAFVAGLTPVLTRTADLPVADAEPWQAVIGNDDDTAYVILRRRQQVVRIDDLDGKPAIASAPAATGSEPTGLAISPTGRTLYVANWADGTITVVDAATMTATSTIDLNAALVETGALGPGVIARPGLAHPRAIVVTNDGDSDDSDETLYVTEYFGQARTDALPAGPERFDVQKRGIVYALEVATPAAVRTIDLAPISDTGFVDSAGNTTGCYPNQLQTIALDGTRLYVGSLCASPRGPTGPVLNPDGTLRNPANFRTQVHTTIHAIDTMSDTELTSGRVQLTRAFQEDYLAACMTPPAPGNPACTADDASRRFPLIATDLQFLPGGGVAYLTAYGSDAVFRVRYAADGTLAEVGSSAANFIPLAPGGAVPSGQLPLGIAIARGATPQALVLNEATRNVSVISFATQAAIAAVEASRMPAAGSTEAHVLDGRRFFVTGLGRWSFRGQAWNSCESCHGDGLTDNVTWFFARGPRQSTSLDGSYDSDDPSQRRVFNWSAIFDETHDFELNTRGNSGGVGAIVHASSTPAAPADRIHFDGSATIPPGNMATATPQAGLNGSTASMMPAGATMPRSVLADWDDIDEYMKTIRSPRGVRYEMVPGDISAGRALFEANFCAGCHGTSMWTISRVFWTPGEGANHPVTGSLRTSTYTAGAAFPAAVNPPSAGVGRTATLRFPAGPSAGADDQIQCILRAVGTFPSSGTTPIGPEGIVASEVRADMSSTAQGASGYNPPALLGLATGAPYYHAGNARTLEEAFSSFFDRHHTAFSVNFLVTGDRPTQVRQLVSFLLSIDEDTTPVAIPSASALGYQPELCPGRL